MNRADDLFFPMMWDAVGFSYRGSPAILPEEDCRETRTVHGAVTETARSVRLGDGLMLSCSLISYDDYPVSEFYAALTNEGGANSGIIEDFAVHCTVPGIRSALLHGNGDTKKEDGYSWQKDELLQPMIFSPADGTSCNGAFPYFRLFTEDAIYQLAVGWPARWKTEFLPADGKVTVKTGLARCHTVLRPGDSLRTPRLTIMRCPDDETAAVNLWRGWYRSHILPDAAGKPMLCEHLFGEGGMPEFTGATEAGQLAAAERYIARGLRPDVWWLDAGWYPCDGKWTQTGTWMPDPARFPRGLKPLSDMLHKAGIRFLLWFEPERVRPGTKLFSEHPEWLLSWRKPDGTTAENYLLNLGSRECREYVTELVSGLIKENGVDIYRQDFNFDPAPYWEQAEDGEHTGLYENLHAQGYLAYWDALRARHPGLLIDSCASGGRRNDLETMRRAVPLHYTDVGYGNHLLKERQHRQMLEWIPFFRAHNMNWLEADGTYGKTDHAPDRFAYLAATAPCMTDMTRFDADEDAMTLARRMQETWRRAADVMVRGTYYPLTEREPAPDGFYAMQFYAGDTDSGFLLVLSNPQNSERVFTARLRGLTDGASYRLTRDDTDEAWMETAEKLSAGLSTRLAPHTGVILFYERAE